MAKATLIFEDGGQDGDISILSHFEPNGMDEQSNAHLLVARLMQALAYLGPNSNEGGAQ